MPSGPTTRRLSAAEDVDPAGSLRRQSGVVWSRWSIDLVDQVGLDPK